MLSGRTVTVLRPVEGPPDAMGMPTVARWEPEEVGGVLVTSPSHREPPGASRLRGSSVDYVLRFPKSYEPGDVRGCRAVLGEGYDGEYEFVGPVERFCPEECPTAYDKRAPVRRAQG